MNQFLFWALLGVVVVSLILAFGREGKPCERNATQEQLDDLWRQRAEQRAEEARRNLND